MELFNPNKRAADKDAHAGVPMETGSETHILRLFGPRPSDPDPNDPQYRLAQEQVMQRAVLEEREKDQEFAQVAVPPWAPFIGYIVAVLLGLEIYSTWDLASSWDVPTPTRLALCTAIAMCLFGATAMAAKHSAELQQSGRKGATWAGALVLLCWVCLVVASVVVRWNSMVPDENGSDAGDVATSLLLAAAAIGPAALAKKLFPEWLEARRLRRIHKQLAASYRRQAQDVTSSQQFLTDRHNAPRDYDNKAVPARAEYESFYRRAAATRTNNTRR